MARPEIVRTPSIIARGSDDPPPRLAAIPGHPDYDPVWSPRVRGVWLGGREMGDVVRFDVVKGWVETLERDDQGEVIRIGADGSGGAATTTRHGAVEVRFELPPRRHRH